MYNLPKEKPEIEPVPFNPEKPVIPEIVPNPEKEEPVITQPEIIPEKLPEIKPPEERS